MTAITSLVPMHAYRLCSGLLLILISLGCGGRISEADLDVEAIRIRAQTSSFVSAAGQDEQGRENAARNCISWKYAIKGADTNNACIKLMQAGYTSADDFYTFPGTVIGFLDKDDLNQLYAVPSGSTLPQYPAPMHYPGEPDMQLEAIWGPQGALCVEHPRWKGIAPFNMWETVPIMGCSTPPHWYYDPDRPWKDNAFSGKGTMISYSIPNDVPMMHLHRKSGAWDMIHNIYERASGDVFVGFYGQLFKKPPLRCIRDSSGRCVKVESASISDPNFTRLFKWVRSKTKVDGSIDTDTIVTPADPLDSSSTSRWSEYRKVSELGYSYRYKPSSTAYRWADSTVELFLIKNTITGRHAVTLTKPRCSEVVTVQSLGYIMKYPYDLTGWYLTELERVFCGTTLGTMP